jgi:hypothetical protein
LVTFDATSDLHVQFVVGAGRLKALTSGLSEFIEPRDWAEVAPRAKPLQQSFPKPGLDEGARALELWTRQIKAELKAPCGRIRPLREQRVCPLPFDKNVEAPTDFVYSAMALRSSIGGR